jgi:chaperonin GroES|nr:MAG TPA: chaperonin [Crassvirales sp.]
MKLIPINNYVILQDTRIIEEKTASGLILPSTRNENVRVSDVYEVNANYDQVKKSDSVLHHKSIGTPFRLNGMELVAVRQEDLMAKISDE